MKNSPLIFTVIEYGPNKQYSTFTELTTDLALEPNDSKYLWQSLTSWESFSTQNPNHILVVVLKSTGQPENLAAKDRLYTILPNANISYVDYLEILEARRNSKSAFILSRLAILISIGIGAIQI